MIDIINFKNGENFKKIKIKNYHYTTNKNNVEKYKNDRKKILAFNNFHNKIKKRSRYWEWTGKIKLNEEEIINLENTKLKFSEIKETILLLIKNTGKHEDLKRIYENSKNFIDYEFNIAKFSNIDFRIYTNGLCFLNMNVKGHSTPYMYVTSLEKIKEIGLMKFFENEFPRHFEIKENLYFKLKDYVSNIHKKPNTTPTETSQILDLSKYIDSTIENIVINNNHYEKINKPSHTFHYPRTQYNIYYHEINKSINDFCNENKVTIDEIINSHLNFRENINNNSKITYGQTFFDYRNEIVVKKYKVTDLDYLLTEFPINNEEKTIIKKNIVNNKEITFIYNNNHQLNIKSLKEKEQKIIKKSKLNSSENLFEI
jgi:hypothetical protein